MKLYELPHDQGIKIKCETSDGSEFVTFGHIDGMYSYCETEKGNPFHLSASTPLVKSNKGDYYNIKEDA